VYGRADVRLVLRLVSRVRPSTHRVGVGLQRTLVRRYGRARVPRSERRRPPVGARPLLETDGWLGGRQLSSAASPWHELE